MAKSKQKPEKPKQKPEEPKQKPEEPKPKGSSRPRPRPEGMLQQSVRKREEERHRKTTQKERQDMRKKLGIDEPVQGPPKPKKKK